MADSSESEGINILKSKGLKITIPEAYSSSENGSDTDSESVTSLAMNNSSDHSAPVELITEFLSKIMLKDYKNALTDCNKLLEYEPDNEIVNKFYLIITERLRLIEEEEYSNGSHSSGSELSSDSDEDSDSDESSTETDSDDTTASWSSIEDDDNINVDVKVNSKSYTNNKGDNDTPAFASTSSDNNVTTAQSSTEGIDMLRAKVVPPKSNSKKK